MNSPKWQDMVQTSSNNSLYGTNFKSRVQYFRSYIFIFLLFNDSTYSNSFEYILHILEILAIFQMTLFQGTILHQLAIQSRMSFPLGHVDTCTIITIDIKFMLNFKIEITISSSIYCNSASL